jgi:hypothetical protein
MMNHPLLQHHRRRRRARGSLAAAIAGPSLYTALTSSCIAFSPRMVTVQEIFSLRRMLKLRTV